MFGLGVPFSGQFSIISPWTIAGLSGQPEGSFFRDSQMPKQKTNKSVKKRFRITGTGKIKRNKCGKRHLLAGRTSKRKRQLRRPAIETGVIGAKYLRALLG